MEALIKKSAGNLMKKKSLTKKATAKRSTAKSKDSGKQSLQKIMDLLKNKTKTELTGYKLTTIKRRIRQQMSLHQFEDLESYENFLRGNSEALLELHKALFIHVTEFFR